jgi:uncharacterized protein RhaS with RHS repeats
MSPDPAGMAAVDPTNPQSWNRYTYVLNNPLALIDPLGEQCFYYLVWDDGWHQVSADGFCGPSGGGGGPPSDGGGNSAGGGGNGHAANQQTKQQCINSYLQNNYGNFMANTGVPSFSAISIFTNTMSWLQGEGLSILAKGVVSGAPMAYGKILTTTGCSRGGHCGSRSFLDNNWRNDGGSHSLCRGGRLSVRNCG